MDFCIVQGEIHIVQGEVHIVQGEVHIVQGDYMKVETSHKYDTDTFRCISAIY